MATRKFYITYVTSVVLLLESAALGYIPRIRTGRSYKKSSDLVEYTKLLSKVVEPSNSVHSFLLLYPCQQFLLDTLIFANLAEIKCYPIVVLNLVFLITNKAAQFSCICPLMFPSL